MKATKKYEAWLAKFKGHLLQPDMPLITLTSIDPDVLLRVFCAEGIAPKRAAGHFNRRFVRATQAAANEAKGQASELCQASGAEPDSGR